MRHLIAAALCAAGLALAPVTALAQRQTTTTPQDTACANPSAPCIRAPVLATAPSPGAGTVDWGSLDAAGNLRVVLPSLAPALTFATTYVSVTSSGSMILAANPARKSLAIFDRGTGLADLQFGAMPTAGQALPIAAAASSGGAGGGYVWGAADGVDRRALYAICASGVTTNLVIMEGQ